MVYYDNSDKDRLYYEIKRFLRNNKVSELKDIVNDAINDDNDETSEE